MENLYCLVTLCLRAGMTNMGPRAGEGPPSLVGRAIHLSSGDFLPPRSSSFASSFTALVFVNVMFNYRRLGMLSSMMLGKNDFENHTFLIYFFQPCLVVNSRTRTCGGVVE